jgi:hypothetical protein
MRYTWFNISSSSALSGIKVAVVVGAGVLVTLAVGMEVSLGNTVGVSDSISGFSANGDCEIPPGVQAVISRISNIDRERFIFISLL